MRYYLSLTFCFFLLIRCTDPTTGDPAVAAAEPQLIFLVRHAEKAQDDPDDPTLTEEGAARAEKLAEILSEADISHIFSTDYKRTRETGRPLANRIGKNIEIYDPNDAAFIEKLRSTSGNILVVGHSNSTPKLINQLLEEEKHPQLDDSEYGKLYVLSRGGEGYYSTTLRY